MKDEELLKRITFNPEIFGGKPIIRGMRIAVEHILGMLASGSTVEELLEGYPFLEKEDIQACLVYARRVIAHERVEPALTA
ncbi:MAG: hypothetical protein A2077_07195 [Nitrospirae bacterium GWC2_46_6]|nr:MAG: hypothetical protein A2077_07195 [Nitrospirae bacterium GWC2_46_6]OGW21414.1 MAG: hypothetical protein A2Z82_05920 [Nitrospirae bacterium GWA2_46_11]OGW23565.1 MAG: hypothetical protein A2X55_02210 [Nitrospirae bacterium GWB2_47_37]HAK88977.1 hypothetical protein [Nitrospiraceae bacterium]HCL81140.1 hypothetical protein [Nitrospiraceae bacterium]